MIMSPLSRKLVGWLAAAILLTWLLSPREKLREDPDNPSRFLLDADFVRSPYPPIWDIVNFAFAPFATRWFPLTSQSIISHAQFKGCTDFWDNDYWRTALDALTHSIKVDAPPLSATGRFMLMEQWSDYLCVQHKVSRLLKSKGREIRNQGIIRPIIIAGPPRTSSTFLLNVLSRHPNATAVTYGEAVEPVASSWLRPKDLFSFWDYRYYKVVLATTLVKWLIPSFGSLFGNLNWSSPFEEMQLGAVVFGSSLFLSQIVLPSYSEWFFAHDQTPVEEYTKLLLQVIQYQRGSGPKTWILKSPQNSELLYAKAKVFPDAIHVFTRRNEREVLESLVAMLSYTNKVFNTADQDLAVLAKFWIKRQSYINKVILAQHNIDRLVPRNRQLFVEFQEFIKDPVEVLEEILDVAGLDHSPKVLQSLQEYAKTQVRQGAIKYRYDIYSFGVSDKDLAHLE